MAMLQIDLQNPEAAQAVAKKTQRAPPHVAAVLSHRPRADDGLELPERCVGGHVVLAAQEPRSQRRPQRETIVRLAEILAQGMTPAAALVVLVELAHFRGRQLQGIDLRQQRFTGTGCEHLGLLAQPLFLQANEQRNGQLHIEAVGQPDRRPWGRPEDRQHRAAQRHQMIGIGEIGIDTIAERAHDRRAQHVVAQYPTLQGRDIVEIERTHELVQLSLESWTVIAAEVDAEPPLQRLQQ
jgi:hypothetical protein